MESFNDANIIESQLKTIATFYGYKVFDDDSISYNGDEDTIISRASNIHDLWKITSSWDWLMPVVDKIESIEIDGQNVVLESIGKSSKFILRYGARLIKDSIGSTKLESVYKSVLSFIEYYNANK